MKKNPCILCRTYEKLTREHRIKRSLLTYFNDVENKDEDKALLSNDGSKEGGSSNIGKARNLMPKKNICIQCNGAISTDCDRVFDELVISVFEHQVLIDGLSEVRSPD